MTAFRAWRPHQCVGRWWQSRLIDEGLAMGVDSTLDSSSGTLSALVSARLATAAKEGAATAS